MQGQENSEDRPEGPAQKLGHRQAGQEKGLVKSEEGQEPHQVDAPSTLGCRHLLSTFGEQDTQLTVSHFSESPPVASLLHLE